MVVLLGNAGLLDYDTDESGAHSSFFQEVYLFPEGGTINFLRERVSHPPS